MTDAQEPKPLKKTLLTKTVTKETLEDLYFTQGKSLEDISKEFKCTRQMVKLLMERYGIARRKRSEARVLAIRGGKIERLKYHDINDDFFSAWSPAMAWVLGLIFTDGCMQGDNSKRQSVSISSMDLELLEKVRNHLGSSRPIRKCVQSYDKTRHIFQLEFYREKMRDDLQRLGLVQKKSLIMKFPDVPQAYVRHFIRGCWDGDGTVYIDKAAKFNAGYVTGSEDFMRRLVEELSKAGISKTGKLRNLRVSLGEESFKELFPNLILKYPLSIHKEKRSNAYTIKLNSRSNLEMLFHYLYDGVDDSIYLGRKYDMFLRGLHLTEEARREQREKVTEEPSVPISTRPLIEKVVTKPELTHEEKVQRALRMAKRRVLLMSNPEGKLKCVNCGATPESLYVETDAYCSECLAARSSLH